MSAQDRPVVLCFHHAGADTSAFTGWSRVLGGAAQVLPVRLPGRGPRFGEPRITAPSELDRYLEHLLDPVVGRRPHMLYGHSLGGLVAHRWALRRAVGGHRPPDLVALGAVSPPFPVPHAGRTELTDAHLLEYMASLGTPTDGLGIDRSIWTRFVLPVLRADLRLAAALADDTPPLPRGAVPSPILAVTGLDDPLVPPGTMVGWADRTQARFTEHTVRGGHFFAHSTRIPVLIAEEAGLTAAAGGPKDRTRVRAACPEAGSVE
ncbi:surfactin synthase thioesterase subunit [Nocardiopsis arvandica]|uniref:Surfactin synthase thioesterase subunit n=1 Tax=Nocardiopsis sinuspersici TaxID=501010 RepID=A0A7Z0BMV1_9ACTN|nr:alpha/beta fold hydrolase [Nocardiopsis sinuspersici]NYH55650.1 surfactin synthase thioesterase subunit [Nocardiopsis sinuspersici]